MFTHAHVSMIAYRVDVYRSRPIGATLLCPGGHGLHCSIVTTHYSQQHCKAVHTIGEDTRVVWTDHYFTRLVISDTDLSVQSAALVRITTELHVYASAPSKRYEAFRAFRANSTAADLATTVQLSRVNIWASPGLTSGQSNLT